MRARGPRFAWWLIPVILFLGGLVGAGVRAAIGGRTYVDISNVAPPPEFVDPKLAKNVSEEWSPKALMRKKERMSVRAVWHTDDGKDPKRIIWMQSGEKPLLARDSELEGKLESMVVDEHLVGETKRRETLRVGHVQVVVVETVQGNARFQYAFMIIADEFWTVGAIAFDSTLDITSAFDGVLTQLTAAPIKHRSLEVKDYGVAASYGLGIAFLPALVVAFVVSIRRRHAWERQKLAEATAKTA
jgi:hypothetical protein